MIASELLFLSSQNFCSVSNWYQYHLETLIHSIQNPSGGETFSAPPPTTYLDEVFFYPPSADKKSLDPPMKIGSTENMVE